MPVETPFEDLEMRSLLSRSNTYGRLYSASWRGAPVAVKVRAGACSRGFAWLCMLVLQTTCESEDRGVYYAGPLAKHCWHSRLVSSKCMAEVALFTCLLCWYMQGNGVSLCPSVACGSRCCCLTCANRRVVAGMHLFFRAFFDVMAVL